MTAVAGAVGSIAIWAGLSRAMRRALRERQWETEQHLRALNTTVKALQARVVELSRVQAQQTQGTQTAAADVAPKHEEGERKEPVKPEIVVALTAAATAFLGKKARIRSARALPAEADTVGAWAQQGRVIVQTSHNLRPRA